MSTRVSTQLGGREISIETGKLARQAGGSVTVQAGDTIVLVTATGSAEPKKVDFLPLTVDFIEKTFAAGKIPGGFFKREGRPSEFATLISRFIDRPIRPLFPEGYRYETQVIATVLSVDPVNDPDTLAIIGASTALCISDVPFVTPVAGCRVGRVDGKFVINPAAPDMEKSDIDLIIAATESAVVMVEGGGDEVPEKDLVDAIQFAHESLQAVIRIQKELMSKVGKPKREVAEPVKDETILKALKGVEKKVREAITIKAKQKRYDALAGIKDELEASLIKEDDPDGETKKTLLDNEYEELKSRIMRGMILSESKRIDGRGLKEIRPITAEVAVLPRTHGSGLFTRGETQAMVVATLGSSEDEQIIDSIMGDASKTFMLHYNFPPFSVGEVKPLRSPGRREIGHGALAERSIVRMLPPHEKFPYTIRVVSEILESNGSSSMATVCGASLSLMDAGVPIKAPVAGIAMGLIKEDDRVAVLSDILGDEDHLGDMDFKVAGTEKGVTAFQMDIKISGLTVELMTKALAQAREGRLHILGKMSEAIAEPRTSLSKHAPKIVSMVVAKDRIRDVIGSGGKNIRGIIEATGCKIDIEDDGTVKIFSSDDAAIQQAMKMVKELTAEAEIGQIYEGTVRKIMDFGAFVEILPKTDGLVHISELSQERVRRVEDVVREGDRVTVKCIGIDDRGKIRLSMKQAPKE
ncbi:MAG: polyribonucleotide nucleotidyltransferase [Deltaproteobacteria bacterium]|nr:polyribonucleotide nucleotidyltransferase [Deltaproteobacteria bacterium]